MERHPPNTLFPMRSRSAVKGLVSVNSVWVPTNLALSISSRRSTLKVAARAPKPRHHNGYLEWHARSPGWSTRFFNSGTTAGLRLTMDFTRPGTHMNFALSRALQAARSGAFGSCEVPNEDLISSLSVSSRRSTLTVIATASITTPRLLRMVCGILASRLVFKFELRSDSHPQRTLMSGIALSKGTPVCCISSFGVM